MTVSEFPPRESDGSAWPDDPRLLVDTTRCPACFSDITASPCAVCGLDLRDGRTFELLALSKQVATLAEQRVAIIDEIRASQRVAEERQRTLAAAAASTRATTADAASAAIVHPASIPTHADTGIDVGVADADAPRAASTRHSPSESALEPAVEAMAPGAAEPPVPVPPAPSPDRGPRRSGVQVFLLSVGVVLLAVAAVFFLTVAWISGGLVLRSAVIGLGTAAVIATASILRRRALTATAEGIAALGVALVMLDVWAVRANDLAGSGDSDPGVYWGIALILAGTAFIGWARLSRLRTPLLAGLAAVAIAPGLVSSGVVAAALVDGGAGTGWFAFSLPVLIVTLATPLVGRVAAGITSDTRIETGMLRGIAAVAACIAAVTGLSLAPGEPWAPVVVAAALAAVIALHAAVLVRDGEKTLAPIVAAVAVLVLGGGVALTAIRLIDPWFGATVPVVVASLVALALEGLSGRAGSAVARRALTVAAATAGVTAALAAVPALLWTLTAFLEPVQRALVPWRAGAFDASEVDATSGAALAALAAVVVLAALAWRLTGRWSDRRVTVLWASIAVLLLAGPQWRVVVVVVAWYLVLAGAAFMALHRRVRAVPAPIALTTVLVAAPAASVLSFASAPAWVVATLAVLALLWAARRQRAPYGVVIAVSIVVFAAAGAALVPPMLAASAGLAVRGLDAATAATTLAALLLAGAVLPLRRALDDAQREAAALAAAALALLGLVPALVAGASTDAASTDAAWWLMPAAAVAAAAALVGVRAAWNAGGPSPVPFSRSSRRRSQRSSPCSSFGCSTVPVSWGSSRP